jgi:hypothetical protein
MQAVTHLSATSRNRCHHQQQDDYNKRGKGDPAPSPPPDSGLLVTEDSLGLAHDKIVVVGAEGGQVTGVLGRDSGRWRNPLS